jgi:RNA polymerase sigma factor (sigma-70 family)
MPSPDEIFRSLKHRPENGDLWTQLYDLLEPKLTRFCFFLVRQFGSQDDPSDIVQDVLLKLVQEFPKIAAPLHSFGHLQHYLYRACRNRIIDHQRRLQTAASAEEILRLHFEDLVSANFLKEFEKTENRQFLEEVLKTLSFPCRELISDYLFSEQSLADYAEARGIKLGTIYKQWSRCLEEIRKKVASPVRNVPSQP